MVDPHFWPRPMGDIPPSADGLRREFGATTGHVASHVVARLRTDWKFALGTLQKPTENWRKMGEKLEIN